MFTFHFTLFSERFSEVLDPCTVQKHQMVDGSTSESTLGSCTVQEISVANGSASEALQTCEQYMEMFTLLCTVQETFTLQCTVYGTSHRS